MMNAAQPFRKPIRGRRTARLFGRSEDGSATIEVLLWIPFIFAFFFLIFEASHVLYATGQVRRIVQDGNRQFVKGAFDGSTSALETWIETTLDNIAPNADATASVDAGGRLITRTEFPLTDVNFTSVTKVLKSIRINVGAISQTEL